MQNTPHDNSVFLCVLCAVHNKGNLGFGKYCAVIKWKWCQCVGL